MPCALQLWHLPNGLPGLSEKPLQSTPTIICPFKVFKHFLKDLATIVKNRIKPKMKGAVPF